MLCKRCAQIYNLEDLIDISDKCKLCNNIWEKLYLPELPSRRVAINIIGFDDSQYLLKPKTTLRAAIKQDLVKRYDLILDSVDPDYYIEISPHGINIKSAELFLFGRYWKLKPNISQKRWRNFTSVEELIGEKLKHKYGAKKYTMHASGREDVDAINIAGRPFVMELEAPSNHIVTPEIIIDDKVVALIYGRVRRRFRSLVSDSHFDKGYLCYHRTLKEHEITILNSLKNIKISQYTPKRVEKRRALKTRYRKLYYITSYSNFSRLYTEAGMYVKELFHGDEGRTEPNLSNIIREKIRCDFLIVSRIYDRFLDIAFNRFNISS